ncbi:hypothetical protein [Advenella kashmirensis]|uniref:hypothetical protein n=1 Tax=Advenella kashmirensis TaxID=310575 RepID=UPI00059F2608|nr:hypothetical protein [Advenella kashmirensis]
MFKNTAGRAIGIMALGLIAACSTGTDHSKNAECGRINSRIMMAPALEQGTISCPATVRTSVPMRIAKERVAWAATDCRPGIVHHGAAATAITA